MAVSGKKDSKQLTSSLSSKGSDQDLKVYCQPCDRDGPRLTAYGYCKNCCEHLCESCFKHHKKHTLSRDHILLDKANMPQTLQQPQKVHSRQEELTKPCPKHKREVIKFFCNDHQALICNVCVTLEHPSSSCNVNYIPDISENIIDGIEYHDLLKTIDDISTSFLELKDNVNKACKKSNASLENALKGIKEFRKVINQRIDELEIQIKDKVRDIQHENSDTLKKIETACHDETGVLQTASYTVKQLNTSKEADELFIEVKCAEQAIKGCEKTLADVVNIDVKEYEFKPNEEISMFLTKQKWLGSLVPNSIKIGNKVATPQIKPRELSYQGDICVQTTKDKNMCWITGMTVLTPDLLVICDYSDNKSVKLVDTRSQSVSDQLQLNRIPYGITTVTSTEVVVTLPLDQRIQIISVHSNKLTQGRTMKVDGKCKGISCHQDKLVVSYYNPAKLQILDMNGTVLNTLENKYFIEPLYVVANSCSIYVSDRKFKKVTKLNWQGEVIGSYGDVDVPKGLVLLGDGNILVCDRTRNVIEKISGDCCTGEVVLRDLKGSHALCWCTNTNVLYYSSDIGNRTYNNFLHIYKLS